MMKKLVILSLLIALLNIYTVFAISLDVSSKPVSNAYIIEIGEPVVFDLDIINLGEDDSFEIYSLVGIEITPKTPINIESGKRKEVRIEITPQESLRVKRDSPFTFEYKIKNSKNEIQKETLSINIIDLGSALTIVPEAIHPNSEKISISVKNNVIFDFLEINIKMTSAFFEDEKTFSLKPGEKKDITVLLNKEKLKNLDSGIYLMNSKVNTKGKKANIESKIKFLEQEGIETTENKEGTIIQRLEIIKKNTGNIKKTVSIVEEKNFFSYLFTTTNIQPTKIETSGLKRIYKWEKELIPNEELTVIIRTNWLFPIIIIIIIIFAFFLIRNSIYTDLELRKKVSFVKTKGGEFALKVTLRLKAKRFVEKLNIIDKLPPLVDLHNKFGLIKPNKIDINNKRLEWDIESLNKGETRIFTYIIYSKIGVVGRFELPGAKVFYERDGKMKETASNKSFYVNEPSK